MWLYSEILKSCEVSIVSIKLRGRKYSLPMTKYSPLPGANNTSFPCQVNSDAPIDEAQRQQRLATSLQQQSTVQPVVLDQASQMES